MSRVCQFLWSEYDTIAHASLETHQCRGFAHHPSRDTHRVVQVQNGQVAVDGQGQVARQLGQDPQQQVGGPVQDWPLSSRQEGGFQLKNVSYGVQ